MASERWLSSLVRVAFVGTAAVLGMGIAQAQSASAHDAAATALTDSSSSSSLVDSSALAEPSAPAPAAGGQYDNRGGGGGHQMHGIKDRLTWEAGGGFNAPIGNDTPYITWGGNFTLGAGLRLNKAISVLAEYQFIDDKLPGALVAAGGGETGNAHINSITVSPMIDLFPKKANSAYVVGGGGWYHKSTNFNIQECCDFYGYPVTVTANSFTSNQLGGNIGFGISHRFAGMYGDGTTRVFAEARYLFINTPGVNQNNGLGTTELIPVTLGVRF